MSEEKYSFPDAIRLLRTLCNLDEKQIAAKLGITAEEYIALENGEREPTEQETEAIANFFNAETDNLYNIDKDFFLTGIETPENGIECYEDNPDMNNEEKIFLSLFRTIDAKDKIFDFVFHLKEQELEQQDGEQ